VRAVALEFIGTLLFMTSALGSIWTTMSIDYTNGSKLGIQTSTMHFALCFAGSYFVLAYIFAGLSGEHYNPAVSFAFMVARIITPMRCGLYMLAQFAGAIMGTYGAMHTIGIPAQTRVGWNFLTGASGGSAITRGFLTECVLTLLLTLVFFAAVDPKKKRTGFRLQGISIAIALAHLLAMPITGCGTNPARSLAPALFVSDPSARSGLWVFLLAPLVGAAQAGLLYPFWFADENFSGTPLKELLKKSEE